MKDRTALSIFILFAIIYALTAKGRIEVTDTVFSYKTAKAIVENRSFAIDCGTERMGYCFTAKDGKVYSKYGPGVAFIFVPFVIIGKFAASFTHLPEDVVTPFLISFYNIFFGAGACAVSFLFAKRLGFNERTSSAAALIMGLATMCWCYAGWDFSETAQMFFLLAGAYCMLNSTRRDLLAASAALSCLILIKAANIAYLPFFLWYLFSSAGKGTQYKKLGYLLSFIAVTIAFILFLNYIRFGNIFETGYGDESQRFSINGLSNIKYLLFSLNKGIFVFNPVLLLSVFGFIPFFKRNRREAILFLSLIAANLCLTAMWFGWGGGWSWGPRLLLPTLPFWLLPIIFFLGRTGAVRIAAAVLVMISFLVQLPGVLQSPFEYLDIKYNRVSKELQEKMPLTMMGSFIILKHKIFERNRIYRLSEFGIDSDKTI